MTPYRLHIQEELCWGCKTCEVACKQENGSPAGVKLIEVVEEGPLRREGDLHFTFRVRRCLHCADPECVTACPEGALIRRPDGIVTLDREECTGCEACIEECPYEAIAFNRPRGVAAKCDLCAPRIDAGLLPACADNICPAHCIHLRGEDIIVGEQTGE